MIIDSVVLTNYRCHANLEVEFKAKFNVIVGVNGSGKTSLLKAIRDAMCGLTNYIPLQRGNYQMLSEDSLVRTTAVVLGGRYRFEPQYPVKILAKGYAFDMDCEWTAVKDSQVNHANIIGMPPGQAWNEKQRESSQQGNESAVSLTMPVLAFYGANRHWNYPQPHEMQAATDRVARSDGYASWWNASLDSVALQSWVISKCLERFQSSSESGEPFDSVLSDELALVNKALSEAVEGVKGLKYDLRQKSLLVEWMDVSQQSRDPTAFENLSDGQRAVIALVADIARRMCVLNAHLGQEVTNRTHGLVLIDELDMHLHPRWQRILTGGLKRAFPEVQFIVASHSPQVLGELKPEEIVLLRASGSAHPQVSYGLTSNQVLEVIMEAGTRTSDVQQRLSDTLLLIERGDLESAKINLSKLEAEAPGIPEIAGARALIRRKEAIGR